MKKKFFRLIADLRFAILILLMICFFSIIGTIIEQDQSIETYKLNYPVNQPIFNFLTWDLILKLGFDHVYRTWWFFSLTFLFGVSLISCTFLQQLPILKIARRCQFIRNSAQFLNLKFFTSLKNFSLSKILLNIRQNDFSIFHQKNNIYCYKGLIGHLAPILVHISMILILIGIIFGSFFGFKAQEIVPETENFHVQNVLSSGYLTTISKTSGRINNFWITYNKNQTISQFYSDISILNPKGIEVSRKTISVNSPLVYKNIYYYQTDWNLIGLRIQTQNNEIVEYPLVNFSNTGNKIWLSWISNNINFKNGFLAIVDNMEGYFSIYNNMGQFLGNIELNERITFEHSIIFLNILSSTGLQIKLDPGIPIIYVGFFFLMISTLVSYITYSQVWIIKKNKKLFIGGVTNRAIFDFELEFFKFIK